MMVLPTHFPLKVMVKMMEELCQTWSLICFLFVEGARTGEIEPLSVAHSNVISVGGTADTQPSINRSAIEYIMSPGLRLDSKLLYTVNEKYLYRFKSSYKHKKRYVCNESDCPAALVLVDDILYPTPKMKAHNHSNVEREQIKNMFIDNLKHSVSVTDATVNDAYNQHMMRYIK